MAIAKTTSKKLILEEVKKQIIKYFRIGNREKELKALKDSLKASIKNTFKDLKIDLLDIEYEDKTLRAQKYVSTTITYDYDQLLPILKEAGLTRRVIKKSIDQVELEKAYNEGLISLKDIKEASIVKTIDVFKVSEVKSTVKQAIKK